MNKQNYISSIPDSSRDSLVKLYRLLDRWDKESRQTVNGATDEGTSVCSGSGQPPASRREDG